MKKAFFYLILFVFIGCKNASEEYVDVRGKEYAGSQSCVQCHQNVVDLMAQNSHTKASMPAITENLLGKYDDEKEAFVYNSNLSLRIQEHNDSLYQVVYANGKPVERHRFDIVFGVKHAQTAVFWKDEKLYEMPISYYNSIKNWATSPGYQAQFPFFDRIVKKDCFSCHSSNIESPQPKGATTNQHYGSTELTGMLDKNSLVYGIDCESCHGPAAKHVQHHIQFPKDKKAQFITSHKSLDNQQKLDRCAICHSGNDAPQLKSRFEFRPGDRLSSYFLSKKSTNNVTFDVHGNQLELLKQSQCFIKDQSLNCITCHNPHTNAEKSTSYYSQICMKCHKENSGNFCTSKSVVKTNCIDCHMPIKNSDVIRFTQSGSSKKYFYSLRTHQIGIYPVKKKD